MDTNTFIEWCKSLLTAQKFIGLLQFIVTIIVITVIFKMIEKATTTLDRHTQKDLQSKTLTRFVGYIYYVVLALFILNAAGVNLKALWGATGIAGIAIGFASQTTMSNLISGLFVLGERTFKVGDFISVNGVSGTVDSVGLLSAKVHNLDNQVIRIPNSVIINNNFQNNSYNDIRRMTFEISVSYDTNMRVALEALERVAPLCPTVLSEPESAAWFNGFGDSGINMVLAVWFKGSDLVKAKNEVFIAMKEVFDGAGIEIPYSRIDVSMVS